MNISQKIVMLGSALLALTAVPVLAQGTTSTIFGTVNSVSPTANTISVSTMQGDTGTVHVTRSTIINTSKTIDVSDLKVGDRIHVTGAPTGITADSIVDGDMQAAMPAFGGFRGGPGGPGGFRGGPGGPGGPGGNIASAQGVVTSVSPLTIDLGGGTSLTITLSPTAKVTAIEPETVADIKAGDRIMAGGSVSSDGSMTADKVAVNLMPGRFPGGRGPGG